MPPCAYCSDPIDGLAWTCDYCEASFCVDHRFPERHRCRGIGRARTLGAEFGTARVITADAEELELAAPEPEAGRWWLSVLAFVAVVVVVGLAVVWVFVGF